MKNIFRIGILVYCLVLFSASFVSAAEPLPFPLKVGVFELQKVMRESKVIDGYRQQIGKEIETKKKMLTLKQETARELEDRLIRDGQKLSPQEKASLDEKLATEIKELKRLKEDIDLEIQKMDRQLTQKAFQRIDEEIKKLAQKEKYIVILEKNAGGVAYFHKSVDVTAEIIGLIDKR
jgi:outer membrane protein